MRSKLHICTTSPAAFTTSRPARVVYALPQFHTTCPPFAFATEYLSLRNGTRICSCSSPSLLRFLPVTNRALL